MRPAAFSDNLKRCARLVAKHLVGTSQSGAQSLTVAHAILLVVDHLGQIGDVPVEL